ncbi:CAAX amino terminal protease family protein [Halalkalibacter wakoensis JCM 9140]|uniref:CAAX amino terminal protease family protein n=1 Tax=Halalkalibacter wakoensis JCM 9140 TaxID=1236970 RepID=W4PYK8_9BACI|nr:type II CAAX endopeptidase family protein [Halalkalibacter wakoensis]GAE24817.1 CAAX amino terminal protease family protein [Halalkalibacter wakoensis JCM 9140]
MNKNNVIFTIGMILALILLSLSFSVQPNHFWTLFPFSLLLLTIYSWIFERHTFETPSLVQWIIAIGSGVFIYLLFAIGKWLIVITDIPLLAQLQQLYLLVQPVEPIHYVWLFLVIIPGEEWFWRGFVVKHLSRRTSLLRAAFIGTLLYGAAHIVTGSILLVIAALIAGFVWSLLYVKTENIILVIVSHLIFNLFLLVLFPLM